ncbi:MAG: sodium:calcium antiporter [Nanobdellota archaeon]
MSTLADLTIIAVSSLIIFIAGDRFASASSNIGEYFNMPNSVKGATLDAISSSSPEVLVAIFSVVAFKSFEIGVGTIVGSALFNLLFIPAICVLSSKRRFNLGKDVIYRDGGFYLLSLVFLMLALLYSKTWGIPVAIIFLLGYCLYVYYIIKNTEEYWQAHKQKKKSKNIDLKKNIMLALTGLIFIGISTYFLTGHSELLAEKMGIHPVIIGFTVVAIATSLPDGVISVADTKKGTNDDAISNMLGSNIFNIFVGLSIPLLIATIMRGPVNIGFHNIEVVIALLITTSLIVYLLHKNNTINKKKAIFFLIAFAAFQAYFFYLAIF